MLTVASLFAPKSDAMAQIVGKQKAILAEQMAWSRQTPEQAKEKIDLLNKFVQDWKKYVTLIDELLSVEWLDKDFPAEYSTLSFVRNDLKRLLKNSTYEKIVQGAKNNPYQWDTSVNAMKLVTDFDDLLRSYLFHYKELSEVLKRIETLTWDN